MTRKELLQLGAEYQEAIDTLCDFEQNFDCKLNCVHDLIDKLIQIVVEE